MSQVKISDIHAGKPDAREDISRNKREFMNSYLIPPNLNVKTLKDPGVIPYYHLHPSWQRGRNQYVLLLAVDRRVSR